jgi:hypothetical protein
VFSLKRGNSRPVARSKIGLLLHTGCRLLIRIPRCQLLAQDIEFRLQRRTLHRKFGLHARQGLAMTILLRRAFIAPPIQLRGLNLAQIRQLLLSHGQGRLPFQQGPPKLCHRVRHIASNTAPYSRHAGAQLVRHFIQCLLEIMYLPFTQRRDLLQFRDPAKQHRLHPRRNSNRLRHSLRGRCGASHSSLHIIIQIGQINNFTLHWQDCRKQ